MIHRPSAMRLRRFFVPVAALSLLAPGPSPAQGIDDLKRGIEIFEQVQGLVGGNSSEKKRKEQEKKEREKKEREEEAARTQRGGSPQRGGAALRREPPRDERASAAAAGLARRVAGNWQRASRSRRVQPQREFLRNGRYEFREGSRVVERGRWTAADGETIVLRPDGGRSPARLIIPRVDRNSMEMLFEDDWENDAQPETWRRIPDSDGEDDEDRPGTIRPPVGPSPDNRIPNGFYRSPNNVTLEARDGFVRITGDRRLGTAWRDPAEFSARPAGANRVRFTYQGLEQIGVRTGGGR